MGISIERRVILLGYAGSVAAFVPLLNTTVMYSYEKVYEPILKEGMKETGVDVIV